MVAADEGHFAAAAVFLHGGAAEFATPDDECVFEHSAAFEVVDEGGDGFVDTVAEV